MPAGVGYGKGANLTKVQQQLKEAYPKKAKKEFSKAAMRKLQKTSRY